MGERRESRGTLVELSETNGRGEKEGGGVRRSDFGLLGWTDSLQKDGTHTHPPRQTPILTPTTDSLSTLKL